MFRNLLSCLFMQHKSLTASCQSGAWNESALSAAAGGSNHMVNTILFQVLSMHSWWLCVQGVVLPGRATVAWFESQHPELYQPHNFPVFILQDEETGVPYYGFPEFDYPGKRCHDVSWCCGAVVSCHDVMI